MNNCLFNESIVPINHNLLLKDLQIPLGYLVNNISTKPPPIIYYNSTEPIDDKSIDNCFDRIVIKETSKSPKRTTKKSNKKSKNLTKKSKK
jgi:hypothetical protein